MKKPLKLQDAQIAKFWNDDYELTLIFQPKATEPPIEPEPIKIPTGIKLSEYVIAGLEIPTGIKLSEVAGLEVPTNIKLSTYKI